MLGLAMFSCSSSDSDSCEPITCFNGGISTSDCGCDCPEGYTGANCSVEVEPATITITKVIVKVFPNTNNGSGWDVGIPNPSDALPDIYITFQDSNLNVIYNSPVYYENAISGGGIFFEFTPNLQISNFANPYLVNIWDYDASSDDDFMTSYGFFVYTVNQGFPEIITVVNQSAEILVDLELSYQW